MGLVQTAAYVTLADRDRKGSEGSRLAIKLQTFPTYRRHPMASPRRVVLLATLVLVLIATALLADEVPVAATAFQSESVAAQWFESEAGQFSLAVRQQPLALNLNDGAQPAPVHRQTDGAALARYLERPNSDDGKLFGLSKSGQEGNGSFSVAGLSAGYGEIFSREYVSPHNRNGTEIEEPTTAYLKTNFSF
jgi:hypothetical protein